MAKGAQCVESSFILLGTQFTGKSPSLPGHLTAAAFRLRCIEGFGHRTFPSFKFGEAETLSGVVAAAFVVRQNKAGLARALEAARGVGACAKLADVRLHITFINVYALVILHFIAWRTDTSEGSIQVLAGSWRASTWQTHTLIDIDTVFPIWCVFIAIETETLERAQTIDTMSIPAHLTLQSAALINVHAVVVVSELKAGEAQTVVGANSVFTGAIAAGMSVTLINVHAHGLVQCGLEAIVTETAVASLSVNALAMAADIRNLLAFVTIDTGPTWRKFETWGAFTAVAAWDVDTVGVSLAQVVPAVTLINIFTDEQDVVVAEAHGTFTAETADLVDTDPVGTDPRDLPALININWFSSVDVNDEAWGLVSTQQLVFGGGWSRTSFTGLVPGFAHVIGTAAHLFGHVEGQLIFTGVIEVTVTDTLPHVHAVVSSIDLHVLWRAHAGVVAQSIVAGARPTDANVSCTFINIFTDSSLFIEVVSSRALALEAAKSVHTVSSLAQSRQLLALIDVFKNNSDGVWSETFSTRTKSFIFSGVGGRTEFTRVSPGSSQGAAAGGSGHPHSNLCTARDPTISSSQDIKEAVPNASVHTAHTSGVELKVSRAVAEVAAWSVHTQAIDAVHRVCTLIDVRAVSSTPIQLIAVITDTAKHSWEILTRPKNTNVLEIALIDILAGLVVLCGGEAHLTLTAVSAWSIQTLTVFTQVHIVCTLIHVRA